MTLQGKETVYTVDVELDQIMTFFRVSLVNIYTYLARLMGYSHLGLVKLLYTVLRLTGEVVETVDTKQIILEANARDPDTMQRLSGAVSMINALEIHNVAGQKVSFSVEVVHPK
jgi:hypothetical protein